MSRCLAEVLWLLRAILYSWVHDGWGYLGQLFGILGSHASHFLVQCQGHVLLILLLSWNIAVALII